MARTVAAQFKIGSAMYEAPKPPMPQPTPTNPFPSPLPPPTVTLRGCGCGVWEGEWCDCDEYGQGAPDIAWPGPIGGAS